MNIFNDELVKILNVSFNIRNGVTWKIKKTNNINQIKWLYTDNK